MTVYNDLLGSFTVTFRIIYSTTCIICGTIATVYTPPHIPSLLSPAVPPLPTSCGSTSRPATLPQQTTVRTASGKEEPSLCSAWTAMSLEPLSSFVYMCKTVWFQDVLPCFHGNTCDCMWCVCDLTWLFVSWYRLEITVEKSTAQRIGRQWKSS